VYERVDNLIKVTDRFVQHLEMLREPACTRCKPHVFGMGAYNDFRVSIFPFTVAPFRVYTLGPALPPMLQWWY
jgi:hypothetical protein